MKWTLVAACAAALSLASIGSADAKGCLKADPLGATAKASGRQAFIETCGKDEEGERV